MKYSKDYITSLDITYEEFDMYDKGELNTMFFTIGEQFDDTIIDRLCDSEDLIGDISKLLLDEFPGECKSIYIIDNNGTVLYDSEAD